MTGLRFSSTQECLALNVALNSSPAQQALTQQLTPTPYQSARSPKPGALSVELPSPCLRVTATWKDVDREAMITMTR